MRASTRPRHCIIQTVSASATVAGCDWDAGAEAVAAQSTRFMSCAFSSRVLVAQTGTRRCMLLQLAVCDSPVWAPDAGYLMLAVPMTKWGQVECVGCSSCCIISGTHFSRHDGSCRLHRGTSSLAAKATAARAAGQASHLVADLSACYHRKHLAELQLWQNQSMLSKAGKSTDGCRPHCLIIMFKQFTAVVPADATTCCLQP